MLMENRSRFALLSLVVATALVGGVTLLSKDESMPAVDSASTEEVESNDAKITSLDNDIWVDDLPVENQGAEIFAAINDTGYADTEALDWQPSDAAVASLKDAMKYGDPRTPRLAEAPQRELPTEQELADPKLYLEYQMRQKEQVYQSFVKAAAVKITELEALISAAEREGGVSEDQLEEGRRKLEALKRGRDEVLAEHPEAALDSQADSVEE